MVFNRSILFSIAVHAAIVTAAVAVNGRGMVYNAPADHILVSLFSGIAGSPAASLNEAKSGKSNQRNKKEIKKEINREAIPLAMPVKEAEKLAAVQAAEKIEEAESLKTGEVTFFENAGIPSVQDTGIKGDAISANSVSKSRPGENGGGSNKEGIQTAYSQIRAMIEKAKTYPLLARKRKIEGTVVTEFIINRRGYPENIAIAKGSGYEILDSAALNIISRAAPFPAINGHIVIPITFSLTGN